MALVWLSALWDSIKRILPTWMGGEGGGTGERIANARRNKATIPESTSLKATLGAGGYGGGGFVGMADGGLVASGGVFKVGERGEELVVLPSGTRVFNNQQTRSMGNTINVAVNGRVGATEQELNDLARKLGEKINREMNRFGASGYRG